MVKEKMRVTKDPAEAICGFCNRPNGETGDMLRSRITGVFLCHPCTEATYLIFARVQQLEVTAKEQSDEKVAEGHKKNEDGSCNCPACTFNRLFETDAILNSLMDSDNVSPVTRH